MSKPNNLFEQALAAEGVSGRMADLARSIHKQESSGGKNTKTSNAGAVGGMQIIPGTFKEVADKGWDINDPLLNARAGIRYIKKLDGMSGGNSELTAVGYYGGPGGMRKAIKGQAVSDPRNPKAPNTLQYAKQVVSRMGAGSKPTPQQVERMASRPVAPNPVVGSASVPAQVQAKAMNVPTASIQGGTFQVPQMPVTQQQAPVSTAATQAWDAFMEQANKRPLPQAVSSYAAPAFKESYFDEQDMPVANTGVNFSAFGNWGQPR